MPDTSHRPRRRGRRSRSPSSAAGGAALRRPRPDFTAKVRRPAGMHPRLLPARHLFGMPECRRPISHTRSFRSPRTPMSRPARDRFGQFGVGDTCRASRLEARESSRTFAQMGLCDAITNVLPDCHRTVSGALSGPSQTRRVHRADLQRGAHLQSFASTKALKKSGFLHARTAAAAAAAALRAPVALAFDACGRSRAAPASQNNCVGVLTVEKTVIRFRPSRRCCRNE